MVPTQQTAVPVRAAGALPDPSARDRFCIVRSGAVRFETFPSKSTFQQVKTTNTQFSQLKSGAAVLGHACGGSTKTKETKTHDNNLINTGTSTEACIAGSLDLGT